MSSTTLRARSAAPRAALGPVPGENQWHVPGGHDLREQGVLRHRVRREVIDRHHAGQSVMISDIVDVSLQVRGSALQGCEILLVDVIQIGAAMIFEGPNGCDNDHRRRSQSRLAAFYVDEFFRSQICAETGFRHHVVGQLQGRRGGQHRITAVSDIGKTVRRE